MKRMLKAALLFLPAVMGGVIGYTFRPWWLCIAASFLPLALVLFLFDQSAQSDLLRAVLYFCVISISAIVGWSAGRFLRLKASRSNYR